LLKLATRITDLKPIGMPDINAESAILQFSKNATISGWGDTGSGNHSGSDDLLFGTVRVIDNVHCSTSYPLGQILDGMVCANDQLTSTCHGDSGGPLIMRTKDGAEYIEGITSWGNDRCGLGQPSVYTRVPTYYSWIQTNIASEPACEN
jgi:secreted trypsin-like serine protease